jgi:hypothetical protein
VCLLADDRKCDRRCVYLLTRSPIVSLQKYATARCVDMCVDMRSDHSLTRVGAGCGAGSIKNNYAILLAVYTLRPWRKPMTRPLFLA